MNKTGIIYIIKCKDKSIKDCYIGSTINLKNRIILHKSALNNKNCKDYNCKKYKFIRENGGFDNFYFEILKNDIDFDNKRQLTKIERYYIEEFKSSLNTEIPHRTDKEKKEYNNRKKQTKKYYKQYYENNKKKINEKRNEYCLKNKEKINCNCGSIISKLNYSTHCKSKKHLQYIENNN